MLYLPLKRSDFENFGVTLLIGLTICIALFHFPIIYFGSASIGVYDIFVIFLFVCIFIRSIYKPLFSLGKWKPLFLIILADICYYFVRLDYYSLTDYKILLIIKYFEHFFLFFILVYFLENEKINFPMLMKYIKIIILVFSLFSIYQFMTWGSLLYRVGLPYTVGVSSNPAGFVLGAMVIFYIEYVLKKKPKLADIGIFVLLGISFLLTQSRTNFIGLLVAYAILYFIRGFKYPKRLIISIIVISAVIIAIYFSAVYIVNSSIDFPPARRFAVIIMNPSVVFADTSFQIRYIELWPMAFGNWLKNGFTFFFGMGLVYIPIVDGTLPRLLGNQGIVGLLFFVYIWIMFFLRRYNYPVMWILMVFLCINALNADTLVVSYRAIQAYIVFLMMIIYYGRQERSTEKRTQFGKALEHA